MRKIISDYFKIHSFNETFMYKIQKLYWRIEFVVSLIYESIQNILVDFHLLFENQDIIRKYLMIEFWNDL